MPETEPTEPRRVRVEFRDHGEWYASHSRTTQHVFTALKLSGFGAAHQTFNLETGVAVDSRNFRVHPDDLKKLQAEYAAKQQDTEAVRLIRALIGNGPFTPALQEARAYLAALDAPPPPPPNRQKSCLNGER